MVTRRPPSRASEAFLSTMAQGQWAEEKTRETINSHPSLAAIKYGQSRVSFKDKREFKEYWEKLHEQIMTFGKRPDVLVFKKGIVSKDLDLSGRDEEEIMEIVKKSIAGLECRSSTWILKKYRESTGRDLSFTAKEEDLDVIKRWRTTYENKKVFYVQLFFDDSFAISFDEIIHLLGIGKKGGGYKVRVDRETQKSTYFIPVSKGIKFAEYVEMPTLGSKTLIDEIGKVMAIRMPSGGKCTLSEEFVEDLLR